MHAREIKNWVETCCGELAYEMVGEWEQSGTTYDEKATKLFKEWKKNGVSDIAGAYADHQYNDAAMLEDLLGDKVYEAAETKEGRLKVLDELDGLASFGAWKSAIKKLREDFTNR